MALGFGVSASVEAAQFSGRPLKMTAVTRTDHTVLTVGGVWKTVPGMVVDFTTTKEGAAVVGLRRREGRRTPYESMI